MDCGGLETPPPDPAGLGGGLSVGVEEEEGGGSDGVQLPPPVPVGGENGMVVEGGGCEVNGG